MGKKSLEKENNDFMNEGNSEFWHYLFIRNFKVISVENWKKYL